jgi:hypothetical protein
LRWDHADLFAYYNCTFLHLQPILEELFDFDSYFVTYSSANVFVKIDELYDKVLNALKLSAIGTVPVYKKNFFKFWWSQELDCLKDRAIESDKLWKAAGRPRSGSIYSTRNADKRAYRLAIRNNRRDSEQEFTNDLHDALLRKNGTEFWKSWNSKFNTKSTCPPQVDSSVDPQQIAAKFARYFAKTCSNLTDSGSDLLNKNYNSQRVGYVGAPLLDEYRFDAELVENVINDMKRGKAPDLDGLSIEHLINCHPILPCILARFFNLIIRAGYVPAQFGLSYTVPLLKGSLNSRSKNLTCDDFRGISISPVLSKIFEHCILNRFRSFFHTSDQQFGFKKTVGCSHAIYIVRSVVDHYVSNGSTVNLCALDVSKAFDKMNHCGVFVKLMKRGLPVNLLSVLEDWFGKCFTCVKWNTVHSDMFKLNCGVRQGGVLSPYLFSVYIDDIIETVAKQQIGCVYRSFVVSIILYADDILLLAPSIDSLQKLVNLCQLELSTLDLAINVKKSVCIRIGPRFNAPCCSITTVDGAILQWVDTVRYLGVYIVRSRTFKCCLNNAKQSFYRAFNSIYGKVGRTASEEVTLSLIKAKCIPCLIYGLDACPITPTEINSLNFAVKRTLFKIFRTTSNDIVTNCQLYFNFPDVNVILKDRQSKFLTKFSASDNYLYSLFSSIARSDLAHL